MRVLVAAVAFLVLAHSTARADDPAAVVFKNAVIYTGADEKPIQNGALIIKDGKIVAVAEADLVIQKDPKVPVIDLKGAVIIPGLVDTHSHIGIYPKPSVPAHQDGNEMSGPVQPSGRALDAVWPGDPGIRMAQAGGVTTANIMPGSGNVIGGQTIYVKLRGDTIEAMQLLGKLADGTEIVGGLKMANGENPKGYGRNRQQAPFTRMKVAALQREQFVKAREYKAKNDAGQKVDRDIALEPLVEVLEKKRTVHFHCHRADDIITAVRLSEEFGFELVLQHATEAYRVAEVLAKKKIPASLTLVDSPGGKAEVMGLLDENAAILEKAGVPVCINTDDFITESRFYLRTGAIAVRGGMDEVAALKAITLTPAKVMHLDHRLGSLEKGKDADFVILSGRPFSVYTKVLQTWIDGKKVFDASNREQRLYRDGGWALPAGTEAPTVPPDDEHSFPIYLAPEDPGERLATAKVLAIRAGHVHTASGAQIANGVVVVEDGKITAVGKATDVKIPAGAVTITVRHVTPGLIDSMGVAGLSGAWNIPADQDQDEKSDPNQSDLRVLDGFNPNEPLLEFLRSNGITITHTTPGRVNVIAGTTGVFRCGGSTAESAALNKSFAILVNLGEAPKTAFNEKGPATRMAVAGLVRRAFAEARTYQEKRNREGPPGSYPAVPFSPKAEALLPVLSGKVPVIFSAHRADDIRTALRIADEFKLKPVIGLGTEAYLLADELAKRKVPVIVHPTMQRPGGSMETINTLLANAAVLKAKGVPVVLGSAFEGYVPKIRNLRYEAAMAAANGLGHDGALRAVTIDAAKFLGIDKEYGSIEPGKVADLVLYDGDPFEHATHVTHTLQAGKVVYDRSEYLKLPFDRRILPLLGSGDGVGCCLGW